MLNLLNRIVNFLLSSKFTIIIICQKSFNFQRYGIAALFFANTIELTFSIMGGMNALGTVLFLYKILSTEFLI